MRPLSRWRQPRLPPQMRPQARKKQPKSLQRLCLSPPAPASPMRRRRVAMGPKHGAKCCSDTNGCAGHEGLAHACCSWQASFNVPGLAALRRVAPHCMAFDPLPPSCPPAWRSMHRRCRPTRRQCRRWASLKRWEGTWGIMDGLAHGAESKAVQPPAVVGVPHAIHAAVANSPCCIPHARPA